VEKNTRLEERLLPKGGKDVLIEACAQAIPTSPFLALILQKPYVRK
jgi:hypothetical protein